MKPHKWAKEIKAWADGAEIEEFDWEVTGKDGWNVTESPEWDNTRYCYRIKPQPKEPQYLYVFRNPRSGEFLLSEYDSRGSIGKIKLEDESE
jgi:hypothetical protein